MTAILCLLALAQCPPMLPRVRARGDATTYWLGDGHSGRRLGCMRHARRLLGSDAFRDDLPVIAMRGPPACGTAVHVRNRRTGRSTWALRLDSGPYGCRLPDGRREVLRDGCAERGGQRIAIADLTRAVARAIGADGREPVELRW